MSTLKLHLPDLVVSELALAAQELRSTPEAVAEDMIQRMIALRRIDRLRSDVRQAAGDAPPATEDEILNEIS
jgi:hypothetical protein